MAEEQPIVLLADTFLVQIYAQNVRGNYPQFLLYGLNALRLGLNIHRTTFNQRLRNQDKAKINALKCSCETKQGVYFDAYTFQNDIENVLPVIGSPLYLISSKDGTRTQKGHLLLSSTYKDGIITSDGPVLLTEDSKAEVFAKFPVGDFKIEDQAHRFNYQGTPHGPFPEYSRPTEKVLFTFHREGKDNADFEMARHFHRLNDFAYHNDRAIHTSVARFRLTTHRSVTDIMHRTPPAVPPAAESDCTFATALSSTRH
jgi:hypothetical protein